MNQSPQYPGNPEDPQGGYPNPAGYPPPAYGVPGYSSPPPPPGYAPGGYPPPSYPPPPPPGYGPPGYAPGGYAPPPGGYPPPPGAFPPPPGAFPPPGYPPAGFGGPQGFDIGDALTWSWNKFSKNPAALIVSLLGYAVLVAVIAGVWMLVQTATGHPNTADTGPSGAAVVVFAVGYIAMLLTAMFVQAAYLSGCLDLADGKPVAIGSFFTPRNFGTAILTALLVGLLTGVGSMLFVIPGLIAGFFTQFAIAFTIDRSLSPVDALKASFTTCQANIGGALLAWLAQMVAVVVGYLLCGLGLLVTFPLAMLIQVYAYRRLSGGWLAPVQP